MLRCYSVYTGDISYIDITDNLSNVPIPVNSNDYYTLRFKLKLNWDNVLMLAIL
jgi:hypothetical protein